MKLRSSIIMFFIPTIMLCNEDSLDVDLWNDLIWEELEEINEVQGEVEQVTTVAGVRGSEAVDEILKYLWYRKRAKRNGKVSSLRNS